MKITKGQLKRIIAEEYAVVYGTKRKLTSRQRKIVETKKKRAVLAEAMRNYTANEVLEEGLGSFLKKIGGMLGKASKAAAETYTAAQGAWQEVSDKIDLEDGQKEAFEKAVKNKSLDANKALKDIIIDMPEYKAIVDSFGEGDEDTKAKMAKQRELFAAAISLLSSSVMTHA